MLPAHFPRLQALPCPFARSHEIHGQDQHINDRVPEAFTKERAARARKCCATYSFVIRCALRFCFLRPLPKQCEVRPSEFTRTVARRTVGTVLALIGLYGV